MDDEEIRQALVRLRETARCNMETAQNEVRERAWRKVYLALIAAVDGMYLVRVAGQRGALE